MSQVILFDLDGTLTESGEGIINCVAYALEKLGKKEEHPEKLQCFVGPPLKEQFMKYAGLSEEEAEQAVVYYRENQRQDPWRCFLKTGSVCETDSGAFSDCRLFYGYCRK